MALESGIIGKITGENPYAIALTRIGLFKTRNGSERVANFVTFAVISTREDFGLAWPEGVFCRTTSAALILRMLRLFQLGHRGLPGPNHATLAPS